MMFPKFKSFFDQCPSPDIGFKTSHIDDMNFPFFFLQSLGSIDLWHSRRCQWEGWDEMAT